MKNNTINTNKIKQINQNKVFTYIYNEKSVRKDMIVEKLDMCLSTVNQNLKQLQNLNLIKKDGYFESTGGRKANSISINESYKYSIGLSILKNNIHFVLTNLYCEVIYKQYCSINYNNTDSYYEEISKLLDIFIKDTNIDNTLILGVAIATQGIVINDKVAYGVIMDNNEMSLDKFKKYIKYNVYLNHDSKCAGDLALWKNKIVNGHVFLLNNNIGSAVIVNSSVLNGYSGTIEHFNIGSEELCYCGKKGCLETACSISSIETKSGLTIGDFFIKLRENDENCLSIFEYVLNSLADVISNISFVVNGDIILSGELSNYLIGDDIIKLQQIVDSRGIFTDNKKFIVCETGEYTQAIGASLYYIKQFLNEMS